MWSVMMKTSACFAALCLFGSAGPAAAETLHVTVPFSFLAHGRTMPAGRYAVERDDQDGAVLFILSERADRGDRNSRADVVAMTVPAAGDDPAGAKPALVFQRNGGLYRLADVWTGDGQGHQLAIGASQPKSNSASASSHAPAVHSTSGVVKTIDAKTLVIQRPGKKVSKMTFALSSTTDRTGTLQVGAPVSVRYRKDGKTDVALAVTAEQPKSQATSAKTTATTAKKD